MQALDVNAIEGTPRGPGFYADFPLQSHVGTASTAVVLMRFEPGAALPEHTDSAEELLYVLEGEVEAFVGDETATLRAGEIAVVPALATHGARNVGDTDARILGFFSSSTNIGVFKDPLGPNGERIFVVGAPGEIAPVLEVDTLAV
jgi:quercetin dioxygenase-like cupin family protein